MNLTGAVVICFKIENLREERTTIFLCRLMDFFRLAIVICSDFFSNGVLVLDLVWLGCGMGRLHMILVMKWVGMGFLEFWDPVFYGFFIRLWWYA